LWAIATHGTFRKIDRRETEKEKKRKGTGKKEQRGKERGKEEEGSSVSHSRRGKEAERKEGTCLSVVGVYFSNAWVSLKYR
jgi:hypothetical protein